MLSIPQHPVSAATIFLDQPPSCLQFCPASPNNFIIGTYLLSENKDSDGNVQQTKTGSLQLWNFNPLNNEL
jgi:diphthamide biosynthesis protein 7